MIRNKLSLNKETLRNLSDATLDEIRGGEDGSGHASCKQNSGCDGSKCGQKTCKCLMVM